MNEIELKYKIDNPSKIINKLKEKGCKINKNNKHKDVIYMKKGQENILKIGYNESTIRLRTIDDKIKTLTLKNRGEESFYCKELEFEVENTEKINRFLEYLNYEKIIEFTKERICTKYKKFNICLDNVSELGDYIEIEVLTEKNNINDIKIQIENLAKELGVEEKNLETKYYPQLIYLMKKGGQLND